MTPTTTRPRPHALALALALAAGRSGEPPPLRLNDPARARESIQKKTDRPDRPAARPGR